MRTSILFGVAALVLVPIVSLAASDYLLKLDGVDGETKPARATTVEPARTPATTVAPPATGGTEAGSMYIKIDGVDGESEDGKKGNVDMQWKVEEGEKSAAPGVEPDEIDYDGDSKSATNFGILLGGSDTSDERQKGLDRAEKVILNHATESGVPMESLSLNFTKIEYKYKSDAKLFGFIPMSVLATVEIDETETATVKLPWWSFLVTGVEREEIGRTAKETLSNILKTKHDAVKNAIANVK